VCLIFRPELAEEFGQQGGTLGHGRDDHMFAFCVSLAADGAEAVQGRAADGRGVVAV
jgi:hypothetical protein